MDSQRFTSSGGIAGRISFLEKGEICKCQPFATEAKVFSYEHLNSFVYKIECNNFTTLFMPSCLLLLTSILHIYIAAEGAGTTGGHVHRWGEGLECISAKAGETCQGGVQEWQQVGLSFEGT